MAESKQSASSDTPPAVKSGGMTVKRVVMIAAGALGGIVVLLFVVGLLLALFSNVEATAPRIQIIRDIFIIMLALEFILIVLALAVLILQIARLINLLQNEIKPVLENAQDTVNNAKGTVEFVGSNVTEPLIRARSFMAGTRVLVRELGGIRRAIRPNGKERADESE